MHSKHCMPLIFPAAFLLCVYIHKCVLLTIWKASLDILHILFASYIYENILILVLPTTTQLYMPFLCTVATALEFFETSHRFFPELHVWFIIRFLFLACCNWADSPIIASSLKSCLWFPGQSSPHRFFFCFLQEQPFWFRCVYILIWGKTMLYKYVTCWLVTVSLEAKLGLLNHFRLLSKAKQCQDNLLIFTGFVAGRSLHHHGTWLQWKGWKGEAKVGCLCQHESLAIRDNPLFYWHHRLLQH